MADRLVTVFGGSGFIGRYVVKRLAQQGWRVRVAVRRPDDGRFLKPMGAVGQIAVIQANIRHQRSVEAAVAGADAVINLIGILKASGAQTFEAVQAQGAKRIAEAAKAAGVGRFVQLSAIGADPRSPIAYARTKAAGEAAVKAVYPDAVILRPSLVFGPEDQFFNRFANLARYLPVLPVFGDGSAPFQPVYVGDVAEAVVAAVAEGAPFAERPFELAGPEVLTWQQLMAIVLAATERKRCLLSVPWAAVSLLARLTGWLPGAPITADQVALLKRGNVADPKAPGFSAFGITPTSVEVVVPVYLQRFRKTGQYEAADSSLV